MILLLNSHADSDTETALARLFDEFIPEAKIKKSPDKIELSGFDFRKAADLIPMAETVKGVEKAELAPAEACPLVCAAEKKFRFFDFSKGPVVIAGPCAVESEARYIAITADLKKRGAKALRAALFKPRSSPYAFQGLGFGGADIIIKAKKLTGLPLVTETTDPRQIEKLAGITDILQIGARNMRNYELLKEAGASGMPVLLKRCAKTGLREWLLSAEYLLKYGTGDLIMCERGDNPDSDKALDFGLMREIKKISGLPVFADPSHSAKNAEEAEEAAITALQSGADGLLIEADTDPLSAKVDGRHTVTPEQFSEILKSSRLR